RLARQILRQDAGLPIMRDLFTFDYITEFNLDVLLLLSRWLHNPDEREALAFLFSSFGGYFNPSFFDNLKFNRDWAYQGANGAKWGIIASALAMITHGSVKGFQGVRTWFR